MEQTKGKGLSRRSFLRGACGMVAFPTIISATALGAEGRPAASERIVMGTIGFGGRASGVMPAFMREDDVQMVAVCDVKGNRRKLAQNTVNRHYGNTDCDAYIDLRELLARDDIDAVLIATGDYWHSAAACLSARAGKDMFCEKPMSVTITEGRALVETMKRYGRIFQCGTQRRNVSQFMFAANLVHKGLLGELKTVHAEKAPNWHETYETVLPAEPEPPREVFDWDLWLGPAAWRPYNSKYASRGFWGGHLDFAGGSYTEWGSHTVDLCQWAARKDDTSPVLYHLVGKDVEAYYEDGLKLVLRADIGRGSCGVRFVGTEGWIEVDDSGHIEVRPESLRSKRKLGKGYPVDDHVRDFLNSFKSRRQPAAPAEGAHRSITACHAANICRRLGRTVKWDTVKEEFIGDEQANRLSSRAYREPWRL